MSDSNRLTDEELEAIADRLLAKIIGRLSRQIANDASKEVVAGRASEPTDADFARLRARRRRLGRK